jgi:hypothetical protein
MSSVRTFILLALMMVSPALQAAPAELTQRIAQCTGRMSAEMEFAWLSGQSGDQARLFRSHLEDVLDAISLPGEGVSILSMRIEAKMAHANLLTRSRFNDDRDDARRAAMLATQFAQGCRALLTG